ncbi:MAG TPA: cytochrome c oxidase subunit I [Acidimicrobiales bacterium]|nr:cytochrome c oxidase subunit I [Acidimicrobiales bacterium]
MTTTEDTRPSVQTADLDRAWATPPGFIGWLSNVNHKAIGFRFIVTAFIFLLIGGLQAALIRTQLIGPEQGFLGPDAYNQAFTLHGTTMMFLFAVPMIEGLAMYLVPMMIGSRDLPFPRLNAFGYWLYLFGGIFLYWSLFTGSVPDGGWFNYPPLSGPQFRPDTSIDFWLLGVTMTEIVGIVGALELVVCIARHRAPGMSLNRIPVFVWGVLVTSLMILFAFPPLVAGGLLLELDRKIGTHFYNPMAGGDPILWQHLFWIFGHPEVYIMLIPAVGMLATMVPAFTRRGIVGYPLVVVSLVAIGFISFGLWVHHMFAAGLPALAMAFFTAASMAIAIPSGVQVFALIATLWRGKLVWSTPLLYIVGFVLVFVLGGITGVMVASVAFDWQVHDTFFVVAHFHYVLIGGVVLPILGGLHYWFPKMTGRMLDERLGKIAFWLIFGGMNLTFFPQHILGFLGMPRRVYTFQSGLGWDFYNLVSTLGTYVTVAGFLVYTANMAINWSRGRPAGDNPWDAPGLEWATSSPAPAYNFAAGPTVSSLYPLWEPEGAAPRGQPGLLDELQGHRREIVGTTVLDAEAIEILELPGNSLWPLIAALAIVLFLFAVMIDSIVLGGIGLGAIVGSLACWLWTGSERTHE